MDHPTDDGEGPDGQNGPQHKGVEGRVSPVKVDHRIIEEGGVSQPIHQEHGRWKEGEEDEVNRIYDDFCKKYMAHDHGLN